MPPLTVWAIRAACLHLVAGWSIGALMLVDKGIGLEWRVFDLLGLHIHLLFFGWMVQLAFGVAYWMLPTFGRDRGRKPQAVAAVLLANIAIVVALANAFDLLPTWAIFAAEALAAASFSVHAWPRIKSFGA